jgi:hypothetical protein
LIEFDSISLKLSGADLLALTGGGGKHPPKTLRGLAQHWASRSFSSVVGSLPSVTEENTSMQQFFKLDLQPTVRGERITMLPLEPRTSRTFFAVASDPLIWSQHPDPGRGTREGSPPFFEGALVSKSAFDLTGIDSSSERFLYCCAPRKVQAGRHPVSQLISQKESEN